MTFKSPVTLLGLVAVSALPAFSQGRGGGDWATAGGDAQRTAWVRTDPKLSPETLKSANFSFLWKKKFDNAPRQGNGLTAPTIMDRFIGHRGFRSYAFTGGSSDNVVVMDTDLSRIEWQKHFGGGTPGQGTATCPGGLSAAVTRPVGTAFPNTANVGGAGGGGRGGPAKSGVGDPDEGAIILREMAAAAAGRAGQAGRGGAQAGRGPGGPGRGRLPQYVHAISSDGTFHSMYLSNGEEPKPSVKFLPAGASVTGVAVVDGSAYASTAGACNGAQDGIWSLNMETAAVTSFKANPVGMDGFSFGPEGLVYVATAEGEVVALEPKTLARKAVYAADGPLTSSPILFENKGKTLIAVGAKDGSIHIIDAAAPAAALGKSNGGATVEALSTYMKGGVRYILAARGKSITNHKVTDAGTLETGWTSPALQGAAKPMIVNGIIFALSGGDKSTPAVLYALDSANGKEIWTSGKTITSFVPRNGGLAAGGSAVYFGTHDGTLWAFGAPIEH